MQTLRQTATKHSAINVSRLPTGDISSTLQVQVEILQVNIPTKFKSLKQKELRSYVAGCPGGYYRFGNNAPITSI